MVINLALPLLNESTHVHGEPNYIVERTLCQCQFRPCVFLNTEHTENRINLADRRIPYLSANCMNANIAVALATRSKG
jgi:hypothetical protein